MIHVTFVSAEGAKVEGEAEPGTALLGLGQALGMALEGTCEGQMACSTCHVIIARAWFARLPAASPDEEDLLDLAAGVTATSRLSCQITLTDALDGLEVKIPGVSNDMQVA